MNPVKYKICKKCGNSFPQIKTINHKRINMRNRKFCLDCSPYGTHNTRDLTEGDYGTKIIDGKKYKKCRECDELKLFEDFYSRSEWGRRFAVCRYCWHKKDKQRRLDFKSWCVNQKGGKCIRCGYDKCLMSLDFHHRDKDKKDFEISSVWKSDKTKIMKELDKCDLVCRNCHGEIHFVNQ